MGFMDTLGRIPKILEANLNSLLDKCEDPEKMINQMLVDYKRNLVDVKRDTVEVMADMEMAKKRLDEATADIDRKNRAAEAALMAGNEDDARKLLEAVTAAEITRDQLKKNYDVCVNNANMMKAGYNKLVADIETLEQRAQAAKAQIKIAGAQKKINEATARASTSKISDNFAKYEEKAARALAEANAMTALDQEVETADQIMAKYETGSNNPAVDARLAALKEKLGK